MVFSLGASNMTVSQQELVQAWRHVLELSKVRSTETVCLLTRPGLQERNLAAAEQAVRDVGAFGFKLEPLLERRALFDNAIAMDAIKSANFVIDFVGLHGLRNNEQEAVVSAGARVLYVIEPPEALVRLLPSEGDKQRAVLAGARLAKTKQMKVTSEAGTNLTATLGEYRVLRQWGYSDEPGHWDHWPSSFVATWPNERSAEGTVVLARGDIIIPFKTYVREPITLKISGGYIREISGGLDADLMRSHMEQYDDPEVYAVSHLGWGLDPRAQWSALGLMDRSQTNGNDARAFAGNFMFSTGPNTDAGGTRNTRCHLDMPMRACSVSLDGVAVTINGKLVESDGGQAARASKSQAA
jgi:2,5-dihydroxypyridine 5,6-dioxygenase